MVSMSDTSFVKAGEDAGWLVNPDTTQMSTQYPDGTQVVSEAVVPDVGSIYVTVVVNGEFIVPPGEETLPLFGRALINVARI